MSWVTDANRKYKFSRYVESRRGFRIYALRWPQRHVYYEDRPDGHYRITDFIPGSWIAVNKAGMKLRRRHKADLFWDIELHNHFGIIPVSAIE